MRSMAGIYRARAPGDQRRRRRADALRGQGGRAAETAALRGSHLLLPAWRLPLAQAVSLMHPRDGRPVFAYPWRA
jgi:glycerol-3-phosphate dehydrogenase